MPAPPLGFSACHIAASRRARATAMASTSSSAPPDVVVEEHAARGGLPPLRRRLQRCVGSSRGTVRGAAMRDGVSDLYSLGTHVTNGLCGPHPLTPVTPLAQRAGEPRAKRRAAVQPSVSPNSKFLFKSEQASGNDNYV